MSVTSGRVWTISLSNSFKAIDQEAQWWLMEPCTVISLEAINSKFTSKGFPKRPICKKLPFFLMASKPDLTASGAPEHSNTTSIPFPWLHS